MRVRFAVFVSSHTSRKTNASRPQNACNPKYETRSLKDLVEKSGRKKNSHTTNSTMGVSTSYLSLSLFPRAMGAKDIAEDECRRIHAIVPSRDVRLRARLHGEIFRTPPEDLFLGRGKICA